MFTLFYAKQYTSKILLAAIEKIKAGCWPHTIIDRVHR